MYFAQPESVLSFMSQDAGPMAHPVRPHSYIKVSISETCSF